MENEVEKEKEKEIFVIGDDSRLLVKNFIQKFEEANPDCAVRLTIPDNVGVAFGEGDRRKHFIVCLSEEMDFNIIHSLGEAQKKYGFFVYFIGASFSFGIEEDKYFNKIPSVRFPGYLFDMTQLLEYIEKNEVEKKRVLVVDDEPIMLRSIKNWLNDDFEVSLVNSGKAAIQFLDMHPVDLVLLDYKMPEMDGPMVLTKIRTDKNIRNLPVIFLTAKSDRESVMSVMHLKPEGYILKSKRPDEIRGAVKDFFKNRIIIAE
ncbi:response regulator [Treponema ruminis]|uniref:CheY-like chemotaxis protein n=1 Tax=Treponema ruminis TaxID=744515 RepID=A0A7W8LMG3_9SPIR|nr:response regulator [Treponema ruminis]MBB5226385.1 CheY-like chemotaxis protein [Treponema ruminis]QSI02710.1 response regulator [Treponema ruminis]